jgi:hypothetical protein
MPVAGSGIGDDFDRSCELLAGMTLVVHAVVSGDAGTLMTVDTVLITEDGPEVLSSLSRAVAGAV